MPRVRVIALAAALFLLVVSAGWGSVGSLSRSPMVNHAGRASVGPTGVTGPKVSHVKTRWRATVATLPANAAAAGFAELASISCPSPGNCTAVGSYHDSAGEQEGLMLTEKAGHWGTGVEAVLPADADPSDPYVGLTSVSCTAPGNCTAVGTYSNSSSGSSGLLLTETAGQWAAGVEAVLPASTHPTVGVNLNSVSCASAGNCIAVGSYGHGFGHDFGLILTEKAGQWTSRAKTPLPPDALGSHAELSSVSCPARRACSAVGTYNIAIGRDVAAGEGLLLTKSRGTWHARRAVMPPDGPGEGVILTSVSCAAAGGCGAVGLYNINIDGAYNDEGVLLTEKAGTWRHGVKARPPKTPKSVHSLGSGSVLPAGISCPAPAHCAAMGDYYTAGATHLSVLAQKAGVWRRGRNVPLPRRRVVYPAGNAISCASPGNCTVVAVYSDRRADAHEHGLLLTEVAGRWARGVTAPLPVDSWVNAVSCAAPGRCGAVGVVSKSLAVSAVLLDSFTKPCVVPRVIGMTMHAARHRINSHNCSVGTITRAPSSTLEAGRVISQAPQPGSRRRPGHTVDIAVSSGP